VSKNIFFEEKCREREQHTVLINGIVERAHADERDLTQTEEATVREAGERVAALDRQIEEIGKQLSADRKYVDIISAAEAAVAEHPAPVQAGLAKREAPAELCTFGSAFVAEGVAEEYLTEGKSRALHLDGTWLERAVILNTVPSQQVFTPATPLVPAEKPYGALSVMGRGSVSNDTIYYITENAVPVAGVVAENVAKPEATLDLQPQTAPVVTIAHWVQVTRQALADTSYLQSHIDTTLRAGVIRKLDQQVVLGSGIGGEIRGLDAQTATTPITGTAGAGIILEAITAIESLGYAPNGIIGNPSTLSSLVTESSTAGGYMVNAMGDVARVTSMFGVPLISDMNVPADKLYVSDFSTSCTLWDREQTVMRIGEEHADTFIRNVLTLLAEGRWGFTVQIPTAIAEVTITAV
jgi:HK97 family phage major capsid protein